jgi:hypothetical protein
MFYALYELRTHLYPWHGVAGLHVMRLFNVLSDTSPLRHVHLDNTLCIRGGCWRRVLFHACFSRLGSVGELGLTLVGLRCRPCQPALAGVVLWHVPGLGWAAQWGWAATSGRGSACGWGWLVGCICRVWSLTLIVLLMLPLPCANCPSSSLVTLSFLPRSLVTLYHGCHVSHPAALKLLQLREDRIPVHYRELTRQAHAHGLVQVGSASVADMSG